MILSEMPQKLKSCFCFGNITVHFCVNPFHVYLGGVGVGARICKANASVVHPMAALLFKIKQLL